MRRAVVLNVNDNDEIRYSVTQMLQGGGHEVVEAADGSTALAVLAQQRVDLVLLDVKLPDLSGFEVCQRIKADPKTASTLVVHLSGHRTGAEHKALGLEGGADGYLFLPIGARELLATVTSYLRMRRAEEGVVAAAAQWQTTFESLSGALCLTDTQGFVVRWNGAFERLVGRSRERIEGRTFREVAGEKLGVLELVLAKSPERDSLDVARGALWYHVSGDPVVSADRVTGRVYVISEITHRKVIEQELRESDQRKDLFLAMLAHELRNPLAAASIALHLIDRRSAASPESLKPRATVRRQLGILERMVGDLLEVSRLTRGTIALQRAPMDLTQVVRATVAGAATTMAARSQRLVESYPEAPFPILADATRVEQIVWNLVDNACKYGREAGRIEVAVRSESGWAVVDITDDGIGIGAELLPRVFEAFSQAEHSRGDRKGGLGIGLNIVKNLVELHGGECAAFSEGEGKGTRVTVRFPLAAVEVDAAKVAGTAAAKFRRRVLLIEDNTDLRDTMVEMISIWGHDVRGAADGPEGIASLRRDAVEVALIDIGLPGADGYDVARAIRANAGASGRPFLVALTGYGSSNDRVLAEEAGFDRHLTKPVDPKVLAALLESLG